MKGYFALDLIIDKDDNIKIIDTHGFSDPISFSERAGYKPRKSRIHKFMSLLKEHAQNKKIIYLIARDSIHTLSDEVLTFFNELPNGVVHLDWIQKKYESSKRISSGLAKKEFLFLDQAAKKLNANFHAGWLLGYSDGLCINELDIRKMTRKGETIPFSDIGMILCHGSNFNMHPQNPYYWISDIIPLPSLNGDTVSYVFNSSPKSVVNKVLREHTNSLPDEIYIGMARTSSIQIMDFISNYENFVLKPICAHTGVDINFLSKQDAVQLANSQRSFDSIIDELKEIISSRIYKGFEYKTDCFSGYFMNCEGKYILPLVDIGSYSLQQRIDSKPFKSFKNGTQHTGTIRAQILLGEPIGVMHRFSEKPYDGTFHNITDRNLRTFWERVDDKLEQRIVDFLNPILTDVELALEKKEPVDYFHIY